MIDKEEEERLLKLKKERERIAKLSCIKYIYNIFQLNLYIILL